MCDITSRTKSIGSIRGSILRRQENRSHPFESEAEIENEMIDLSGVRIILAFPEDVNAVQEFLEEEFDEVRRSFWGLDGNGKTITREDSGRFIGYRATHFVVKWRRPADDNQCKTDDNHVRKKIEIQVTSTTMYAWQQAHHDLVYKQLQGKPSEEERSLLEMINGLAHAGEMALTQLQILSRRRIEEDKRDFADKYEVGIWLRTHLHTLLGFRSSIRPPFLERSAVLFDVLSIFNLRTPAQVREALKIPIDDLPRLHLDDDLSIILKNVLRKEEREDTWIKTFRDDSVDWAILRICMYCCKDIDKWQDAENIQVARIKAFCFINTISFALSEPLRHKFIKEVLKSVVLECRKTQESYDPLKILSALAFGNLENNEVRKQLIMDMNSMWRFLLELIHGNKSTFLCIALGLSLAGIVSLPQEELPLFYSKQENGYIFWPFVTDTSDPLQSIGPGVTSKWTNGTRKYNLENLKWARTRISLDSAAQGNGWIPDIEECDAVSRRDLVRIGKNNKKRKKKTSHDVDSDRCCGANDQSNTPHTTDSYKK